MSVINTNVQAIIGARNLNRSQEMLGRSLTRLSSGSRIVNPSDDAAGLAVSEKLAAQNMRVRAATTNVQNAVSYVQTSDGFMSGMTKILSRMSELALLAKDVTKNTTDIALYQQEFKALQDQLRQTIGGTAGQIGGTGVDTPLGMFNGIKLFGDDAAVPPSVTAGSYTPGLNMVVQSGAVIGAGAAFGDNVVVGPGARVGAGATIGANVSIGANAYVAPGVVIGNDVVIQPGAVVLTGPIPDGTTLGASGSSGGGLGLTVSVGQAVGQTMTIPQLNLRDGDMGAIIQQDSSGNYVLDINSATVIGDITNAIQDVANERASLGASQSRLELAASTLQVEYENLEAAISRIRDVDVAEESTQYAKYNILVQSGTAMLAQANQTPQTVLKLLQS